MPHGEPLSLFLPARTQADYSPQVAQNLDKAANIAAQHLESQRRYHFYPWWEKPQTYEWRPKDSRREQCVPIHAVAGSGADRSLRRIANRVASLGYTRQECGAIVASGPERRADALTWCAESIS